MLLPQSRCDFLFSQLHESFFDRFDRRALLRKLARVPSWRSNAFPRISGGKVSSSALLCDRKGLLSWFGNRWCRSYGECRQLTHEKNFLIEIFWCLERSSHD